MNNGWAISVPTCGQCYAPTLAQRALAYGMPTIQVDGNDLFAVYKAHKEAVDRARSGGGPSFVDCVTYRLGDHTTADDARRYRPAEEFAAWTKRDPMIRIRKYLESKGLWDEKQQKKTEALAKARIQDVTQASINFPKPKVDDIFDYVYATLPAELAIQKQTMRTDSIGQDPEQIGLKSSPETHSV